MMLPDYEMRTAGLHHRGEFVCTPVQIVSADVRNGTWGLTVRFEAPDGGRVTLRIARGFVHDPAELAAHLQDAGLTISARPAAQLALADWLARSRAPVG